MNTVFDKSEIINLNVQSMILDLLTCILGFLSVECVALTLIVQPFTKSHTTDVISHNNAAIPKQFFLEQEKPQQTLYDSTLSLTLPLVSTIESLI